MNTKPRLSLAELNLIAEEFGMKFELAGETGYVMLNAPALLSPHLADKCEELGSRWCEPMRDALKTGRTFSINTEGFELTD
jgi:hypothetical protein